MKMKKYKSEQVEENKMLDSDENKKIFLTV